MISKDNPKGFKDDICDVSKDVWDYIVSEKKKKSLVPFLEPLISNIWHIVLK